MILPKQTCLVCGGPELEPLLTYYATYTKRFSNRAVICRACGHAQLDPLWREEELDRLNERFLGGKYLKAGTPSTTNNAKKEEQLQERLSPVINGSERILDIGAGEAWAMDFFNARGCEYSAIEPITRLAESIQERGGHVLAGSLFDESLADLEDGFDLLIFRHVIEHMLSPLDALTRLRSLVKPGGRLYLAAPNAGQIAVAKGVRTSFFRPVHISYFTRDNLAYLASRAGLTVEREKIGSEIFLLLRADGNANQETLPGDYKSQRRYLQTKLREAWLADTKRILKMALQRALTHHA